MKIKTTSAAIALTLGLAALATAATINYSYTYSLNPGHEQGTTIYADDLHTDNGGVSGTTFDSTGDLNDGVVYSTGNPVTDGGGVNSMVAWSSVGGGDTPSTITIDLGALYDLAFIDLTTYARTDFNLGHPDDVTISTSATNGSYTASSLHLLSGTVTGSAANNIVRTDTGVRFIQLAFDGDETSGDKWGLTELAIDGTLAVPEPSSTALLGLGGLALILRRRK